MNRSERKQLSEIMARLADGDRAAFDPVFARLWPLLRGFTVRLLRDESAGEDVAQEALLKLFARAHEYEPGRDALSWALGIAVWESRTWRRRQSRSREESRATPGELPDPAADPECSAIERDLQAALDSALAELGDDDRELLLTELRSVAVDARPATIRKRRQRALARLRAIWEVAHGTK